MKTLTPDVEVVSLSAIRPDDRILNPVLNGKLFFRLYVIVANVGTLMVNIGVSLSVAAVALL
jgi:hypothetical protein